jgi:DNA-binding CsgD family transcriptional regulator
LSEREQAVLHYVKAIYRKLDAAGRRDAVQRGRQLGLMP